MYSITMNDRYLVGWMVTDDTILGTLFMAIHMMEVLKELSPAAIGMFGGGGGGGGRGRLYWPSGGTIYHTLYRRSPDLLPRSWCFS